jgi:hypothetical protein
VYKFIDLLYKMFNSLVSLKYIESMTTVFYFGLQPSFI